MAIEFRYDPEGGYVEATLSGGVTADDLREETREGAALIQRYQCTRYLSDFSAATVALRLSQVYQLPEEQEEAGVDKFSVRIAVVLPADGAARELGAFYETVSVNRGWVVKVFGMRQVALEWLLAG